MSGSGNGEPGLERTGQLPERANVDRLDSWKEIAAYLNRSVRTVQRWEAERGLPVHRIPGRDHGSVTALKTEIDDWFRSSDNLDAGDLPDEAPEAEDGDSGATPASAERWPRHVVATCLLLGAVLGAAILAVVSATSSKLGSTASGPAAVKKFTIVPESGFRDPVISPDGTMIAYVSGDERRQIVVHRLSDGSLRTYASTGGAQQPFWSPDSKFVGFAADAYLNKVSVSGNAVSRVCILPTRMFRGGTWSPDGRSILFDVRDFPDDLYIVDASGGNPERFAIGAPRNQHPQAIGGTRKSRWLLFDTVHESHNSSELGGRIGVYDFQLKDSVLLSNGRFPVYAETGHILHLSPDGLGTLWAQPFDAATRSLAGNAFPVARNALKPSVSRDGTLVYQEKQAPRKVQLLWKGRSGEVLGRIGLPQDEILYPFLSPDETRVAVRGLENELRDIWIHDAGQARKTRLTYGPEVEAQPTWSPSGDKIIFDRAHAAGARESRAGTADILVKPVDQSSNERPLLATEFPEFPADWSSDGSKILYYQFRPRRDGGEDSEIWYLERSANEDEFQPVRYLGDPEVGCCAKFSPDTDFVVYTSDETGRMEVWVSPFPYRSAKWQLSDNGGRQPRWSKDGSEIFYVEGDLLVSWKVGTTPSFTKGEKTALFRSDAFLGSFLPQYDVSRDGQRFVLAEPVPVEDKPVIRVVLNWIDEFR